MGLESFLRHHGVYFQAEENYQREFNSISSRPLQWEAFLRKNDSSRTAIISSFMWNKTPEGYDFWQKMSIKWGVHLENPVPLKEVFNKEASAWT